MNKKQVYQEQPSLDIVLEQPRVEAGRVDYPAKEEGVSYGEQVTLMLQMTKFAKELERAGLKNTGTRPTWNIVIPKGKNQGFTRIGSGWTNTDKNGSTYYAMKVSKNDLLNALRA